MTISKKEKVKQSSAMNLIEILKDVPKGTKLYSPIFGDVIFEKIRQDYIVVKTINIIREFYSDGRYYTNGECMLFPSKDNRDWSNYKLFKAGDFIVRDYIGNKYIGIFSHIGKQFSENAVNCYCSYHCNSRTLNIKPCISLGDYRKCRIATDEEKALLLNEIHRKGYTWNECTLSIDRVNKFDITTLNHFDKVIVRDSDNCYWKAGIYSHYNGNCAEYEYVCVGNLYRQCIPYNDDTKHLVGTNKDCPEYYKVW